VSRRRPLDWGWVLGVPLAAFGAWASWAAVTWTIAGAAWQESAGIATLAILFGGLGALWLITSYRANRFTLERNRRAAAFPDEPWRWRPEWEARRVLHASRKWGGTVLELDTLPARVGGELRGTIVPSFRDLPTGPVSLKLDAHRIYVTGAGKQRRTHDTLLWEGAGMAAMSASADGLRAHFVMSVPGDVPATNDDHPNDEIIWRLWVSADIHGRAFRAGFVVPVFC
jgi:hypothetical protein